MADFEFRILKKSATSRARRGLLKTPHGIVQTPAFVPVATQASIKALDPEDLKKIGVQIVLANTYHLHLQPGERIIFELGGLHRFMNWPGAMMTDSGGFQVFSLGFARNQRVGKIFPSDSTAKPQADSGRDSQSRLVRITDEGVEFTSFLDGKRDFITPEKSIRVQSLLGADLIFAFDECTSPLDDYSYTRQALARTHRWAQRSLAEFKRLRTLQALFGIVQGGRYRDLREESAGFLGKMDFFGFGIGGSLGRSKADMHRILDWTVPILPPDKPRHLLGIGYPQDIKEAVRRGIDLFDCVWPTRLARGGTLIIGEGKLLKITNSRFRRDKRPIMENCSCYSCRNFSRAYLHHLFKARELLAYRLATIHNLHFMMEYMKNIRRSI